MQVGGSTCRWACMQIGGSTCKWVDLHVGGRACILVGLHVEGFTSRGVRKCMGVRGFTCWWVCMYVGRSTCICTYLLGYTYFKYPLYTYCNSSPQSANTVVCSAAKLVVNGEKPHVVVSNVEHPCVANMAAKLEAEGKIGESAQFATFEQTPFTLPFYHQTSWQMAK